METTYGLIKKIEQSVDFTTLLKKGILPISIITKKIYYEYYKRELSRGLTNADAISNTSIEYDVSTMTVRRSIAFMSD